MAYQLDPRIHEQCPDVEFEGIFVSNFQTWILKLGTQNSRAAAVCSHKVVNKSPRKRRLVHKLSTMRSQTLLTSWMPNAGGAFQAVRYEQGVCATAFPVGQISATRIF